jgi:hypothetical protein
MISLRSALLCPLCRGRQTSGYQDNNRAGIGAFDEELPQIEQQRGCPDVAPHRAHSKVFDGDVQTRRFFQAISVTINSEFAQDALEIVGQLQGLLLPAPSGIGADTFFELVLLRWLTVPDLVFWRRAHGEVALLWR